MDLGDLAGVSLLLLLLHQWEWEVEDLGIRVE